MNYQYRELNNEDLENINFLFQDLYQMFGSIVYDVAIIGEKENGRFQRVIFQNESMIVLYELTYDEAFENCHWMKHIMALDDDKINYFENSRFAYSYEDQGVAINDKEHNIMSYLEARAQGEEGEVGNVVFYIEDFNNHTRYSVMYQQAFPYEYIKIIPYALQKPIVIENKKGRKKSYAVLCNCEFNNRVFLYHMLKKYGLRKVWETMIVEGEDFPDEFYVIEGQSLLRTYTLEEIQKKFVIPPINDEIIAMYNDENFEEVDLITEAVDDLKNYVSKNGVRSKVYIRE